MVMAMILTGEQVRHLVAQLVLSQVADEHHLAAQLRQCACYIGGRSPRVWCPAAAVRVHRFCPMLSPHLQQRNTGSLAVDRCR